MKPASARLSEIKGFRTIGERLGSAGQPSMQQFRAVREAGFEVVINLALPNSDNALANEGRIVTSLEMTYVHPPVKFNAPTSVDFDMFSRLMKAFGARRVFVHCAANKRVSAFVFLYRVLHRRTPVTAAEQDLLAIWQPDEVWHRYILVQLRGVEEEP